MASRLRQKTQGWGARIRLGEDLARDEWIAIDLPHDQEAVAKDRLARLQVMAKRLSELGKHAEARLILEEAGATASERGFRAIEQMVEDLTPEIAPQRKPRTFRQVAQELSDGVLHELYPDEIGYRSKENRERRRQQLSVFLPLLGDKTFEQITREDLDEAKRFVPQGSGQNTRRRYLRELRALMRFAVEPLRLVASVPHLSVPKEAKSDLFQLIYPDEELQLAGSDGVTFEDRFLSAFMARKGTRITETLQYTWEAVDLERGIMRVAAEWTKTKRARIYDLDPDVLEALRLRRKQIPDAHLIFVPPPGRVFTRLSVYSQMHPNLRRAGLTRPSLFAPPEGERPVTVHDWRASCVTFARAMGMPDRSIMDRTGHESVEVFEKYDRGVRHARKQGLGWWAPMAWALGMKGAKIVPAKIADSDETLRVGSGHARAKAAKTSSKSQAPTFRGATFQPFPGPVNPQNHSTGIASKAPDGSFGPAGFSTSGQDRVDGPARPLLPEADLQELLGLATKAGRWHLVASLGSALDQLKAERARDAGAVASLDEARARREREGK